MNEEDAASSELERASVSLERGLEKCHELVSECRSRLLSIGDPLEPSAATSSAHASGISEDY